MTIRRAGLLTLTAAAVVLSAQTGHAQFRYPGPYGGPYPYGPYRYMGPEADLKLEVTPKEASVYVDGYFAGMVDEFDGAFQRLRLVPGQHDIVVYLEGYRSIREKLYLGPNTSRKLARSMEKLAPGEPNDPKPEPTEPTEPPRDPRDPRDPRTPPRRGGPPPV
jgi:hypothetical protein